MKVDFRDDGLLWLINKTVFHPRGFALGVNSTGEAELYGDGTEPWHFAVPCELTDPSNAVDEDAKFSAVEAAFQRARTENV